MRFLNPAHYKRSCAQRASISGSRCGRFAFIGKSVFGRLSVDFIVHRYSRCRLTAFSDQHIKRFAGFGLVIGWNIPEGREAPARLQAGPHGEPLTPDAYACRIVNSVFRQGRSEAHGERNNERRYCARPRGGERAVSSPTFTGQWARP